MTYSASNISGVSVSAGPAAVNSGKTLECQSVSGATTCVLYGLNANPLENGVVATALMQLSANSAGSVVPVSLTDGLGASGSAAAIPAVTTGSAITVGGDSLPVLQSLSCGSGTLNTPGTATCTVTLSQLAPAGGAVVALRSSSTQLGIPGSVTIPAGQSSASFSVTGALSTITAAVQLTAQWNNTAVSTSLTLTSMALPVVTSLVCSNAAVLPGGAINCVVSISGAASAAVNIALTSDSLQVIVPGAITIPAGSSSASFTVRGGLTTVALLANIFATAGGSSVSAQLMVDQMKPLSLACSPNPLRGGAVLACRVTLNMAADEAVSVTIGSSSSLIGVPTQVTVPAGSNSSTFTAYSQTTLWQQVVTILGSLNGTAVSSTIAVLPSSTLPGESSQRNEVRIPVVESIVNAASWLRSAACSPGASMTLTGNNLSSADGASARVEVNGQPVPTLSESATRLTFECPDLQPGTAMELVVSNGAYSSSSFSPGMQETSPGIFTTSGSGQGPGLIVLDSTLQLASGPDGTSARPGGVVTVFCTGLGRSEPAKPVVLIDHLAAEVLSVSAAENGISRLTIRIPLMATAGDEVPLTIQTPGTDGSSIVSNQVTLRIESVPLSL